MHLKHGSLVCQRARVSLFAQRRVIGALYRGGDEVNFGEIDGLPEITAALQNENVNTTADLYSTSIVTFMLLESLDATGAST